MYLLLWILFGAIVGWIASILSRNNRRIGLLANIVVGLLGSVIGGGIAYSLDLATISTFSFWGFCFAVLGAVLLLWVINFFSGRRRY
ncbi:MAG: GlsB/YeaQ/YmgE family stress response membrane protein [Firmicutes bacterium]|nr:GlsB/YeaQ/YmgE family stress response membrane protein [Bacillota bacterium]